MKPQDSLLAWGVSMFMTMGSALVHADDMLANFPLNPADGDLPGFVFEAYLSPHQEPAEEEDTPALTPRVFRSTAPSVPRAERASRGHGVVVFDRDLSHARVRLDVEHVPADQVVMFHIHCGRPGQLGPIIADLGLGRDLSAEFADGVFTATVDNDLIVATSEHGNGLVGAFTSGCPIVPTAPGGKVKTVAGMAQIGLQNELYFNLHTAGQTFFGDIRGQLYLRDERD